MLIVFLGPDGSGKTTIINELKKVLEDEGKKIKYRYWRLGILQAPSVLLNLRSSNEPSGVNPGFYKQEDLNSVRSIVKIFYYLNGECFGFE